MQRDDPAREAAEAHVSEAGRLHRLREALRRGGRVTGLDFSERMLERARKKSSEVEWVRGDLLELPFEDASFDAATVGFGIRNVESLERALAELRRVLRPGGRLAILEITTPRGPLRVFYRLWFDRLGVENALAPRWGDAP